MGDLIYNRWHPGAWLLIEVCICAGAAFVTGFLVALALVQS